MKDLIKILENNGFQYYICQMVIHYGKERYDKRMECNYVSEIGGDIDYRKGFQKILDKENLTATYKERGVMEDKKVELDVKKIKELSKGRADYNSLRISGKIKPYPCQRFPDEESYKKWVRYQPQPVLSYHGDFDPEKSEDIWVVEIAGIVPSNPYILRGYLDEF